ncbi:hypothetical protein SAMD00019534_126040 [Acytostelium subglobosum LB1]|uniref:hypothetical protein n=1 Tax=Acytostelium subglobosum LB1 TaxID=1410327 RepID=UPI0006448CB3|nr:hypothetical protein SAMD00019534_126040 [Acytostelium subglobosum LB1]GAM29428.1 hypothetical protein SAMD00019534_126040 [Acytostelium subglobosum LB1]|eukprot:XP_012747619.1 hypothetical protein SAMD00019534_126040 [Acytostelium subglobosum LB1]
MSVFASLLRRSTSTFSSNAINTGDKPAQTPFGDVCSDSVVEPEQLKTLEKSLADAKILLTELQKNLKLYTKKGSSLAKNHSQWANSFSKDHVRSIQVSAHSQQIAQQHQLTDAEKESQTGIDKALEQFTSSGTKTAGFETDFNNSVNESFTKPVLALLANIEERKIYKKKYDKAVGEYETLIGKIKNQQTQKKIDILKLYNYERDKTKAKAHYEVIKLEYIEFLKDTLNRLHTDFIDILVKHNDTITLEYGHAYQEYAGIKNYIDTLRTWCLSEQEFYKQEAGEREQRRIQDVDQELHAKFQPIIQLLSTPPFSMYHYMSEVRKNELFPPQVMTPNGPSSPVQVSQPINFMPQFVRIVDSSYQLSDLLVQQVKADLPNVALNAGTLFANNVIAGELIDEISRHLATPYLKHIFDTAITSIINNPERYDPLSAQGIDALINEFHNTMETVMVSEKYLPPAFKKASNEIYSHFSSSTDDAPLGCLLFGKVFAVSVAKPHMNNLFHVIPSQTALESLHFFSTLYTTLGANQTFTKGPHQQLNDALARWRSKLKDFFGSLMSSDLTEWESQVPQTSTYHNDVPTVQKFLKQHYLGLSLAMQQRGERDLSHQFLVALGHLEAEDPTVMPTETKTN